eukprot:7388254-Prymnesium_polylepis.2
MAATDRGEQDEKHQYTHNDHRSGGHIAAIVAARLQLVKVPGVGGPSAQLAPRAAVATGAVAITVGSRIDATSARTPAPVRLASPLDAPNRAAQLAICRQRSLMRPVELLGTVGAHCCASRRILADLAFAALERACF